VSNNSAQVEARRRRSSVQAPGKFI
jgi:hypothetical protein